MKDTPDNEISKNARLDCWQLREIMQGISSIQSYLASFMFRLAGQGTPTIKTWQHGFLTSVL